MNAQDPGDVLAAGTLLTEVNATSVCEPTPVALAEDERKHVGLSIGEIEDNTTNTKGSATRHA